MPLENNPKSGDAIRNFKNEIIQNEEKFNKQLRDLENWSQENNMDLMFRKRKYRKNYPNIIKLLDVNQKIIEVSDQMINLWKVGRGDINVYNDVEAKTLLTQYFSLLSESVALYKSAAFNEISMFKDDTSIKMTVDGDLTVDSLLSAPMQRVTRIVMPLEAMKKEMEKHPDENKNDISILSNFIDFITKTSQAIGASKKDLFYRRNRLEVNLSEEKQVNTDEEKLIEKLNKYSNVRARYRDEGGKHDKKGSIRDEQIELLHQCIFKIKNDRDLTCEEKIIVLFGVLENLREQLNKNKNSSSLFRVVNNLYEDLKREHSVELEHQLPNGILRINPQQRAMVYLVEKEITLSDRMEQSFERSAKKILTEDQQQKFNTKRKK